MNRGGKGKPINKILNTMIKDNTNDDSVLDYVKDVIEVCNEKGIEVNLELIYKK